MADEFSPERFDEALKSIRANVKGAAIRWAADVQTRMRSEAPWQDRNGPSMTGKNARQSLECEAGLMENGDIQIVARSDRQTLTPWRSFTGAPVAAFLELGTRYMARRAIIWPMLDSMSGQLSDHIKHILEG